MNLKKKILVLLILLVQVGLVMAQPGGGGDPGHGEPVPITGIEILLAVGGFFGIRKHFRSLSKK